MSTIKAHPSTEDQLVISEREKKLMDQLNQKKLSQKHLKELYDVLAERKTLIDQIEVQQKTYAKLLDEYSELQRRQSELLEQKEARLKEKARMLRKKEAKFNSRIKGARSRSMTIRKAA